MPVLPSSKRALRYDMKRAEINKPIRSRMNLSLRKAHEELNMKNISAAYSAIDRAQKRGVIHRNTAARRKSNLGRSFKP